MEMATEFGEPTIGGIILTGLILAAVIIATVVASGQTFGQRCTTAGYAGEDWSRCVHALSNGDARAALKQD